VTTYVEQPRHACTLSGQQTVVAIDRAIPIVHGGPGCSSKLFGGQAFFNGFQGSGYAGGNAIVGTNTGENEIIFGGEDRLRGVIDGALKVMDGDLFVVLTGCTADLVGDDTGQVVSEFRKRGVPIAFAQTGGFKGNSYLGHELVIEAIIDQILEPAEEKIPNLVNVWSVVPYQDTFWNGNLRATKELLEGIGLEVNILFGHGAGGLDEWQRVPAAAFNLVLSPWVGLAAAKLLEEKFETPYLHYPILPIGAVETTKFLREVAEFAQLDTAKVDAYIKEQEDFFYHYLDRSADFFLEMRWDLPDRFINVSDSFYTLGITRFLVNELGLIPGPQFVIDDAPEEFRPFIEETLANLRPKVSAEVTFTHDGGEIIQAIKAFKSDTPPMIIGSSWERTLAKEIGGYQLSVALPVTDRLVLDRGYVGYAGGLRLTEDIFGAVLGSYQ